MDRNPKLSAITTPNSRAPSAERNHQNSNAGKGLSSKHDIASLTTDGDSISLAALKFRENIQFQKDNITLAHSTKMQMPDSDEMLKGIID